MVMASAPPIATLPLARSVPAPPVLVLIAARGASASTVATPPAAMPPAPFSTMLPSRRLADVATIVPVASMNCWENADALANTAARCTLLPRTVPCTPSGAAALLVEPSSRRVISKSSRSKSLSAVRANLSV
jgi:hypothetical protein